MPKNLIFSPNFQSKTGWTKSKQTAKMLSGMMRGIGARGLGGRPYLRTSAVGAAGGGRWGKASAGDVLDVGASPGVVDQLKKKALESKLAARKQPEDPNDWSWFGPRFFLLAVGGLLSAATFGYANNLAQWKDKEEEYSPPPLSPPIFIRELT